MKLTEKEQNFLIANKNMLSVILDKKLKEWKEGVFNLQQDREKRIEAVVLLQEWFNALKNIKGNKNKQSFV